ncbi:MAG: type II secretion system protein [Planctomycetia bacterium]|nr:type II secretion system protein [Planctomycetia bacterium]
MTGKSRRGGFTLIEVLIVVVIMAVLAATIIPQFSTSTKDARESSLKFNVQSLRTQLELYRVQHNATLPDGTNNLKQLTAATDVTGALSPTGLIDATHPYGPYVQNALPVQPFSGLNTVKLDTGAAGTLPTATASPGGGWIYRATTGEIWVDHPSYLTY